MSKFLDKVPNIRDLEILWRLNKLSVKNEFFNKGGNNNFFPPNPATTPLGPPPPPSPSDLSDIPNVPKTDEFHNNKDLNFDFSNGYAPPATDPTPLMGFSGNFFPNKPLAAKPSSSVGTNTTQTMSSDCLTGELERVIEEK